MSLRNLRILTSIASKGSFAAAADDLGLTQSAISLQVKKMEEEFGAQLFDRTGRSLKLNANGRLVVERAHDILALYDGIKDELTPEGMIRGVLTLGVVPTVITGPLPPVLRRLRAHYEDLQIRLQCGLSAELARQVEEGELDAALITEPPFAVVPHSEWRPYDEEPFFVVAPKDAAETDVAQLFAQYPFLRFDKTAWAGAMIDGQLMSQGIHPGSVMEFDSLEAALGLVEHGLGIAVVPLNKKRLKLAREQFSLTKFGEPHLMRRVVMYQKKDHPRRALTDLVFNELCQECELSINT